MAVMRISSCDYSPIHNQFILVVDVYRTTPEDIDGRSYFILAPVHEVADKQTMQTFVERNIAAQQVAAPDWTGTEWKTTLV